MLRKRYILPTASAAFLTSAGQYTGYFSEHRSYHYVLAPVAEHIANSAILPPYFRGKNQQPLNGEI
jgi:hypothetical protein